MDALHELDALLAGRKDTETVRNALIRSMPDLADLAAKVDALPKRTRKPAIGQSGRKRAKRDKRTRWERAMTNVTAGTKADAKGKVVSSGFKAAKHHMSA